MTSFSGKFFPGTNVCLYIQRLILVLETWNHPLSSLYNISGFRLLFPILAYDATNRSKLDISVDKRPISIDFCVAQVQGKNKAEEDEGFGRMEGTSGERGIRAGE
ncbi:hypothetical protein MRB53_005749 [Persea americana]|uniref:Uncharacterized protein n=1 Tax=Persea americana TaxID=3435 RepID=A0ACC2MF47_PERAE|nr:hypothetical protein MRB53_005749 [Persea americana]